MVFERERAESVAVIVRDGPAYRRAQVFPNGRDVVAVSDMPMYPDEPFRTFIPVSRMFSYRLPRRSL